MIAVDTNVLVYATNDRSRHHQRAARVVAELAATGAWGIPSGVAVEFLAAMTDPKLVSSAQPLPPALSALDAWISSPGCRFLQEPGDILDRVASLAEQSEVRGQLVHDARIAATCMAHGVRELWTADGDFLRFGELRLRNPLVG